LDAKTLHIVPGDSAGGSLKQAIRDAGHDAGVLSFPDDLSCGPIDLNEPAVRAAWWGQFFEGLELEPALSKFWERVSISDERLSVWFSRHSARELAFYLALSDRLGDRSYDIIDVTGRRLPFRRPDGTPASPRSVQSVSIVPSETLAFLFGSERLVAPQEKDDSRRSWQ
jgi:hypothetical protein